MSDKYYKEMQPDYEKAAAYDLDSSSDTKLNRKALNAINKHKNMAMEKTTEDDNLNKQKLIEFAHDLETMNQNRPKKNFALSYKFGKQEGKLS